MNHFTYTEMQKHLNTPLLTQSLWFCAGFFLTGFFAFTHVADAPACVISLDKMNLFYIGVDNPVSVLVRGVPEEQIRIQAKGAVLKKKDDMNYNVRVTTPGETTITVSNADSVLQEFKYWVKRIPYPVILLGGKYRSGSIGNGTFKVQQGLWSMLEGCEYDATCEIVRFEVTRVGKKAEPVSLTNRGPRFSTEVQRLISQAEPGDAYFFDDIGVNCPGDDVEAAIPYMSFRIE